MRSGAQTRRRKLRRALSQKSRGRENTDEPTPASQSVRPPFLGADGCGESAYIADLLRQAQGAARMAIDRALADLGVTPPQLAVLTMLNAYPGLSGADVARRCPDSYLRLPSVITRGSNLIDPPIDGRNYSTHLTEIVDVRL
jgi:hypothetical protein